MLQRITAKTALIAQQTVITGRNPSFTAVGHLSADGWLDGGSLCVSPEGIITAACSELTRWTGGSLMGRSLSDFSASLPEPWHPVLQRLFESSAEFDKGEVAVAPEAINGVFSIERSRVGQSQHFRISNVIGPDFNACVFGHEEMPERAETRAILARALRAEANLQSLSRRWPGIIFSQRADFSFSFISERIEALTGLAPSDFHSSSELFWQVVHEDDAGPLRAQLQAKGRLSEPFTTTYRIRHALTGKVAHILEHREPVLSFNGLVLGYEGVWLDITRQRIAEKRLQSASWKETLAVITMGLAHDFSNMMAGIHSLAETFQSQLDRSHPHHEVFALMRRNSLQASQLVQRILSLHQGKVGERNYQDLNTLISDSADVLRKILPRAMELRIELASEQLPLYADAVELTQVLINLALNAADAVPSDGLLKVRTSVHERGPDLERLQGSMPSGPVVCLSLADNGVGISPRHLNAIFDPFFTTKAANKGSGLGLYNAKVFVEKHGGAISVDSVEGVGTTFHLWLPKADFTEADRQTPEQQTKRSAILLMVEPGVTPTASPTFLRQNGFYVACAEDLAAAREFLLSPEYSFDALMLQIRADSSMALPLLELAKQQKLPLRTILQIFQGDPDEAPAELRRKTDLFISQESAPMEIVGQVERLLKNPQPWI